MKSLRLFSATQCADVISHCTVLALFALVLIMTLAACGEDSPITPDVPPASPTHDAASLVGLPITPKGVPLPHPGAVMTSAVTIVSRDVDLPLPSCTASNGPRIDLPSNFAPNFPFPPGLKPIRAGSLNNNPNYVQVIGCVPLTLQKGVTF